MRFSALIPVLFTTAALILTFLCIFAGSKQGFMQDYDIVTVRIPQTNQPHLTNLTSR